MAGEQKKVLLGLTTFKDSDWRDKLNEIVTLGIEEVSLLPDYLTIAQRKELYESLKQTPIKIIPHVKLAPDTEEWELDYLIENYKTKIFTTPPIKEGYKLIANFPKYNTMLYMENGDNSINNKFFNDKLFSKYQVHGISLDLAYLENEKYLSKPSYKRTIMMLDKYPIGCNQVHGVNKNSLSKLFKKPIHDYHLKSLEQLNYLRDNIKNYSAPFIVLKLTNSLLEQQEIKKYIEEVLL